MFTAQKSDGENMEDKSLTSLQAKLKENVEALQQSFQNIWNAYPDSMSAIQFYPASADDILDLHIESLLARFNKYNDISEIQANFKKIREKWLKQSKDKKNTAFSQGYYRILEIMEAQFIEAFIRKLSLPFVPVSGQSPEIVLNERMMAANIPEDKEEKLDLDKALHEILHNYEKDFEQKTFVDSRELFKYNISSTLKDLNARINQCNKALKDVGKFNHLDLDSKKITLPEKIKQLFSEEENLERQVANLTVLSVEHGQLGHLRAELLEKNTEAIEQLIAKCEARSRSLVLFPDINQAEDFKRKSEALEQIDNLVEETLSIFFIKPEQILAAKNLKKQVVDLDQTIRDYQGRIGYFSKFYSNEVANIYATVTALRDGYGVLTKSKIVSPDRLLLTKARKVLGKLLPPQKRIQKEYAEWKTRLEEKIREVVTPHEMIRLHQKVISQQKNALLEYSTQIIEIQAISTEWIQERKTLLDQQWQKILMESDGIQHVEQFLEALRNKILESPLSGITPGHPEEDINFLVNAQIAVSKKLNAFRSNKRKLEPLAPEPITMVPIFESEEKNQKQKGDNTEHSPSPSTHSVPNKVEKDHTSSSSNPFIDYRPPTLRVEKSPSWYSRLIDKPWKQAICVGLVTVALVALALTGWGLLAELSVATVIATIGGGYGASVLGAGSFIVAGASYYSIKQGCCSRSSTGDEDTKGSQHIVNNSARPSVRGTTANLFTSKPSHIMEVSAPTIAENTHGMSKLFSSGGPKQMQHGVLSTLKHSP